MSVRYSDDFWETIPNNPTLESDYVYDFTHYKSKTLKNQVKDYFFEELENDRITDSTLYTYARYLKHFTAFLDEYSIELDSFNELTQLMVEQYIFHLRASDELKTPSSKSTAFSAFKSTVRFGQMFQRDNYPTTEIFPKDVSRLFGVEDVMLTKVIDDYVLKQIDVALETATEDIQTKVLIYTARETGLRLSEILTLRENCVMEDFAGSPILFTYSFKNEKERAIPITKKLERSIKQLEAHNAELKSQEMFEFVEGTPENLLFIKYNKKGKYRGKYTKVAQGYARDLLQNFVKIHSIRDVEGNYVPDLLYHSFRHTIGTEMLSYGSAPDDVMAHLGHESMHSTSNYARVTESKLQADYDKLGFIGISELELVENSSKGTVIIKQQKLIAGSLPDGSCLKAFEGDNHCKKFNACLFCNKYRTYVKDLPAHRNQLERLRQDKQAYADEMSIGNLEYVEDIEKALITIIERLEALK